MAHFDTATTGKHKILARLIVDNGEHRGMVYPLVETVISIGRGPDNTVQLIDSKMSRNHSVLICNGAQWYARDLASKNGTSVNNEEIHGDRLLTNGDMLKVGNTAFVFERKDPFPSDGTFTSGIRIFDDKGLVMPSQVLKMDKAGTAERSLHSRLGDSPRDNQRLGALQALGEAIGSVLNLRELLERVLVLSRDLLQFERSAIMLAEGERGVMVPHAMIGGDGEGDGIVLSESILSRAITDRVAILISDAPRDFRFKASDSIAIQRIASAICTPIIYKREVLGVLYYDTRNAASNYGENDLAMASVIANQAAVAIANSRLHNMLMERYAQERELEIARTIQESLLPKQMPKIENFSVQAMTRPARMVGGDYYDIIALDDCRRLFVVADVSGKGIPAAILIAAVRSAVQVEARSLAVESLVDMIERLNNMVCRDTTNNMFVTMFAGILDEKDRSFVYCNAGHAYPMLCRANGHCETLEEGGTFLGIVSGTAFEQGAVELDNGSSLLLFTDGVTDVMDEKENMFGHGRLQDLLIESRALTAQELIGKIIAETSKWQGETDPFDDFTLLALKCNS